MQIYFPHDRTVLVYTVITPYYMFLSTCHTEKVAAENEKRITNKEIMVVTTTKGRSNIKTVHCKFTKPHTLYLNFRSATFVLGNELKIDPTGNEYIAPPSSVHGPLSF